MAARSKSIDQQHAHHGIKTEGLSPARQKIKWMRENRGWLLHSLTISVKIQERLAALEITQAELALRMNVSEAFVSRVLRGQENLTLKTIHRFEEALGFAILELSDMSDAAIKRRV